MQKKLEGRSHQVRHSAHTINILLSLFLGSKRGYDALQASGLIFLPSPRLLASKTSHCKIRSGGDPSIYLIIQDKIDASKESKVGHLMMDEIKLKMVFHSTVKIRK